MTVQPINVHGWPGRGDVARRSGQARAPIADHFGDRAGLVLVAAADRDVMPETWGLGVGLHVVGHSVLRAVVIVADDLGEPVLADIREWAAGQVVDTPMGPRPVEAMTRSAFCDPDNGLLLRAYTGGGHLVTADEGRTLGLLADWWGPGRGRFKGGHSLGLPGWGAHTTWVDARGRPRCGYRSLLHRPPLRVKVLGGHGLAVEWARAGRGGRGPDGEPAGHWERGQPFLGRGVDLMGPAYGLDGLDTSGLGDHLAAFGLPTIDVPGAIVVGPDGASQLLAVARAIHGLAVALDDEAATWLTTTGDMRDGIARLEVRRLVSSGTVAKALLRLSGITPPLAKFTTPDDDALDRWEQAAHGGECTADIRGQIIPVLDADVRSAYPAAWSLLGCWVLLCAKRLRRVDRTAEYQALCEQVAAGDLSPLCDPATYPLLLALAVVIPDGEPLPVERPGVPGAGPSFDVIPLKSSIPVAVTGPDLVRASMSGRVPRIVSVEGFAPIGSEKVRPILLRDGVVVRPGDDPIPALVRLRPPKGPDLSTEDARLRSAIRVIANSMGWGIFAQLDQQRIRGQLVEQPSAWSWPPIAACVPAVARLWLGAIERAVSDQGGAIASRDTDGIAIVALPEGGKVDLADGRTVAALSWAVVDELLGSFDALDPFGDGGRFWSQDRGTEDRPLHLLGLGPKRYVKAHREGDRWVVIGGTEHSLGGGVVDPPAMTGRDADRRHLWTFPVAEHAIARATATEHGWVMPWDAPGEPRFPVLRRFSAGSPETLADLPQALGAHPFAPIVEGVVDRLYGDPGAPLALDPGDDLSGWTALRWVASDGCCTRVGIGAPVDGSVSLRTLEGWSYTWADPIPVEPVGLVEVDPRLIRRVGRGGALIDALLADPGARPEDHQVVYSSGDAGAFVADVVGKMGPRPFAGAFGLPVTTATEIGAGRQLPSPATVDRVLRAIARGDVTQSPCRACGAPVWRPGAVYCSVRCRNAAASRRRRERLAVGSEPCAYPGCSEQARPRSVTCSEAHKKRLARRGGSGERLLTRPRRAAVALVTEPGCPGCGAVLLGAAATGPCPVCSYPSTKAS